MSKRRGRRARDPTPFGHARESRRALYVALRIEMRLRRFEPIAPVQAPGSSASRRNLVVLSVRTYDREQRVSVTGEFPGPDALDGQQLRGAAWLDDGQAFQ